MIGLGLVTCGRPDYYQQARAAIEEKLGAVVDVLEVYEDGSPLYPYAEGGDGSNHGVGHAKNQLLKRLLAEGCDWLFLSEDDMVVDSPEAITGYVRACESASYGHLMFHQHGTANPQPLYQHGPVTIWPNYVGAWCVYSRQALETAGLMDENFHNCWEHVEHSVRLGRAGFGYKERGAADATGSEQWLHEILGAAANTSIHRDDAWRQAVADGRRYWQETYPATYSVVFR